MLLRSYIICSFVSGPPPLLYWTLREVVDMSEAGRQAAAGGGGDETGRQLLKCSQCFCVAV